MKKKFKIIGIFTLAIVTASVAAALSSCGTNSKDFGINGTPEHTHDYKITVVAPTCTENGYSEYVCKSNDDTYKKDYVEALGHDYAKTITAPTCTEGGSTVYTCSRCGDSYEEAIVDALGHDYAKTITAPSCLERGYTTYVCTVCEDTYVSDYVNALGHNYDKENGNVVAPTCTEEGYTVYSCLACDETQTTDVTKARGHEFDEENGVVTPPTCTEGGYTTYPCIRCDETKVGAEVEPTGHAWIKVLVEPTCEKAGYSEYRCENDCGTIERHEVIEKLTHDYDGEIVSLGNGTEALTCSKCTSVRPSPYTTGLVFTLNEEKTAYSVTAYTGDSANVIIPENYRGLPVNEIVMYCFYNRFDIVTVTIPTSVTKIGANAFGYCRNLTTVFYLGTAEDRAKMEIGANNSLLTDHVYYYLEIQPAESGIYWHYDENGNPVIW